jgi:hypothetical protein
MFANIIPEVFQALQEATGYKESAFGDAVSKDASSAESVGDLAGFSEAIG